MAGEVARPACPALALPYHGAVIAPFTCCAAATKTSHAHTCSPTLLPCSSHPLLVRLGLLTILQCSHTHTHTHTLAHRRCGLVFS